MESVNEKQKMLICLKNFKIGGITSACVSFIKEMSQFYDIDVFCYWHYGACKEKFCSISNVLPQFEPLVPFSCGLRESMNVSFLCFLRKIFLAGFSKLFSNQFLLRQASKRLILANGYDVAISYAQIDGDRSLSACGTAQVVLHRTDAKIKVQYIHDDLERAERRSKSIVRVYRQFNKIVCLSNACAISAHKYFEVPICASPNFYNIQSVSNKASTPKGKSDNDVLSLLVLSRFGSEKGILRLVHCFLTAVPYFSKKVIMEIFGDGPEKSQVCKFVTENRLSESVFIFGSSNDPISLISDCSGLVVCSFHEARPMVVDEAHMLGKRCLLAEYSSCHEQAFDSDIIVANNEQGIIEGLISFVNGFGQGPQIPKPLTYFVNENLRNAEYLFRLFNDCD